MTNLKPQDVCPQLPIILQAFSVIEDPRRPQATRHPLLGLLIMAFCTVAMGADGWDDIADLAEIHFQWFKRIVTCGKSPPCADTFRRVLCSLKPEAVQQALEVWLREKALQHKPGRQICLDGKALRGSKSSYTVNAYVPEEGICLGHTEVDGKENEQVALPRLLDILELEKTLCTGDAIYTQRHLVGQIIDKKADYLFTLKGNQSGLLERAEVLLSKKLPSTKVLKEVEKNRGWVEERSLFLSTKIEEVDPEKKWKGLKMVLRLDTERTKSDGSHTQERRYFITSKIASAEEHMKWIRRHWGIENGLHRVLDVHFNEDGCQVREKTAALNLSLLRKFAGSILRQIDVHRTLKSKMHSMIADPEFRMKFIQSNF